jgi:choline dehydrogenase-like flavoprotein
MIADLDERGSRELPHYDLCIVGSGPAGGTLVRELARGGLKIAVLESGLAKVTPRGDRLRATVCQGIHIKEHSRERVFGGASTTWAGLASPLDGVDLAQRPHVPDSGWPISMESLRADYAEATRYRFPELDAFGETGFVSLRAKGDLQPQWRDIEEKVFLAADKPQDFSREWGESFESPGVDLWLDATVLALEGEPDGNPGWALVRTRSGGQVKVHARTFVLACGGIENARLLLLSNLGNERDQVGRRLMNHPKSYHGWLHLARPVEDLPYYFGCLRQGFAGYAGLRLRTELQTERGLLNSYVRLEPIFPWTDNPGVEALVTFVKRCAAFLSFWKKSQGDEVIALRDYSETGDDSDVQNARRGFVGWLGLGCTVMLHGPRVAQYLFFRLSKRKPKIRVARLRNFMEMAPDPENRVTLCEEADVDGKPLARVTHACGDLDKRSMVAVHEALAVECEAAGLGRLESDLDEADPWPINADASHHMGTTRMGLDPATSVVDPDLRLHAIPNVYLAGASVFPTSGCANPTYTIIALSIRLARHLRSELEVKDPS